MISRSDKTGETAAKPIVSITPAHERRIWVVTVSYKGEDGRWMDERYETTDDHPWRTTDNEWVASASLKQGQVLARENGTAIVAAVADARTIKLTYNLEIADFHTYFVGEAEAWVHNSCAPLALFPTKPGQLQHIFRKEKYHFIDTAENRATIHGAISPEFYVLTNRQGSDYYRKPETDGTTTFVWIRNGTIQNAGYDYE